MAKKPPAYNGANYNGEPYKKELEADKGKANIDDVLFNIGNAGRKSVNNDNNRDNLSKTAEAIYQESVKEKYDVSEDYGAFFSSELEPEDEVKIAVPKKLNAFSDETRQFANYDNSKKGASGKEDYNQTILMDAVDASDNAGSYDNSATSEIPQISEEERRLIEKKRKAEALRKKHLAAERKRAKRRKERLRTFTYIFVSVALVILIVTASVISSQFIVGAVLDYMGIDATEYDYTVTVPEDAITEDIAKLLYNDGEGVINMPDLFVYYSRMSDKDGKYLAGTFTLNSTMSYGQIMATLQTPVREKRTVDITIIDGMTAREVGKLLQDEFVCRAEDFEKYYAELMNVYDFEKRLSSSDMKFYQLEGFLYPDKYNFYVSNALEDDPFADTSENARIAARVIFSNYNFKITPEMYKKMKETGFELNEFMTLASMVQKEAGKVEDMGMVASVFLNRLRDAEDFPYLESDVTILYAENDIRPNMTYRPGMTEIIEAYNTYKSAGLPPGPVCNPGMDAMTAVLNAPATDYYFFCANVETMEIYYARTQAEHEANLILAEITSDMVIE